MEATAVIVTPPKPQKTIRYPGRLIEVDLPINRISARATAEAYLKTETAPAAPPEPGTGTPWEPERPEQLTFSSMAWTGEVPPQKWMNFYTKALSKFAASRGLKLKLTVEVSPDGGLSKQKIEETKAALRGLGLSDDIEPA